MERIVSRSRRLLAEQGPLSHGFYTSGQLFLEEYYTLALIGKAGLPGPIDGRVHRDDLPGQERLDAVGAALPPPPGYGTLPSAALSAGAPARTVGEPATLDRGRSQKVKGSGIATGVAILLFVAVIGVAVYGGIVDGFSLWDGGVIGLAPLGLLVVIGAWAWGVIRS